MNTCSLMNTYIVHTPCVLICFVVLMWNFFFWTDNHNDVCETSVKTSKKSVEQIVNCCSGELNVIPHV